ncbi:MAG: sigma-70 family RNA polymerase sigma factor [Bacteroidetes bacterium]|nr:sigma-70 family RNA polymerase sigma factor [Bacteroidota bacterium]
MNLQDFNTKVYPLKDKIFRFAKRMLDQTEEAEDLVQEVFIRMWKIREKLDEYRSLEALAMVTTKNLCLDKLKARKFPVESFNDQRQFIERIAEEPRSDHSDLITGVKEAMNSLPEQSRLIVHLRDIEGYEFGEISEILGMQENAIRVALSRARQRIREILVNSRNHEYQRN